MVKKDFEKKFYPIDKGINIADMVRHLKTNKLDYTSKFFNTKNYNASEANKYSKLENSITLIVKSEKYPVGHYLLRTKNGWIDSWYNLPSIDNVHAGLRKKSRIILGMFYIQLIVRIFSRTRRVELI